MFALDVSMFKEAPGLLFKHAKCQSFWKLQPEKEKNI